MKQKVYDDKIIEELQRKINKLGEEHVEARREVDNAVWPNINDAMDLEHVRKLSKQIDEAVIELRLAKGLEAVPIKDTNNLVEVSNKFFDFGDGLVASHKHVNGGGWVADTATVADSAYVGQHATVSGDAEVSGKAKVSDHAYVFGDAKVFGNAWLYGNAEVYGYAMILGYAKVCGDAKVFGYSVVYGDAMVYGHAEVYGNADVGESAWVAGYAKVYGNAILSGKDRIFGGVEKMKKKEVTYVDHMGNDLSVINAARVSFGKRSIELGYDQIEIDGYQRTIPHINSKDQKLIRYLALHNHWTPFAHTSITFHIKAPIFVARQLGKHQVGLVWNEISRRYVDSMPELYTPDEWRLAAEDKKQGSSDETVEYSVQPAYVFALQCYQNMVESGIAPEQARMVLPQSTYTEWYWTGSLAAFHRVCTQRTASDAQKETREIGNQIAERCAKLFPVSWRNLIEGGEYL